MLDYAKAGLVADDHASIFAALGHAAGFVVRRCGSVLAIYCGLALLTGVVILLYAVFARFFPQSSAFTVFVWFLVAQALIWVRWLLRLAQWSAATAFYGRRPPAATPAPLAVAIPS